MRYCSAKNTPSNNVRPTRVSARHPSLLYTGFCQMRTLWDTSVDFDWFAIIQLKDPTATLQTHLVYPLFRDEMRFAIILCRRGRPYILSISHLYCKTTQTMADVDSPQLSNSHTSQPPYPPPIPIPSRAVVPARSYLPESYLYQTPTLTATIPSPTTSSLY